MSKATLRRYQFATEAQWKLCLVAQADRELLRKNKGFRPFALYDRTGSLYKSLGAHAPTITPSGVILWHDDEGCLQRLTPSCPCTAENTTPEFTDTIPERLRVPSAIAAATRLVSTVKDLWVIGDPPQSLHRYEQETFSQLARVDLPQSRIVDIARGSHETIYVLVEGETEGGRTWQIVHLDCAGHTLKIVELKSFSSLRAFVFLRRSRQFVVLTDEAHPRLCWFKEEGGAAEFSRVVGALRPCFVATALACDARDRLFLAGSDGEDFCGRTYLIVVDQDGDPLDQIPIDSGDTPITGIAAGWDNLVVTGPRGLLQFNPADTIPDAAGDVSCILVTPMLHSPETADSRGWLRADVLASLPEGTTLEIAVAATSDSAVRDRLNAITEDVSLPESHRIQKLLNQPGVWLPTKTVFHGSQLETNETQTTYSAPLFDIDEPYLWMAVTLSASPRAQLPAISRMAVLYPNLSLIDDLPAMYRRPEGEQSFVRSLIGVLETTTQGLDARIASMGSLVDPSRASVEWLDFIARWLDLPWDNALSAEQKRSIVLHASELAKQRGTRSGLETLLDCLMPGTPRRFRITDPTGDFGFAIVGDATCPGTTLPAVLGGFTRWNAALDERSVLGYMRLPCPDQTEDPARWWMGKIRVEIAASAEERQTCEPWLYQLISEMVPLTARLKLEWVTAYALRTDRLDGTQVLESAPVAHLGTDAITNVARLPEGDTRISSTGRLIGERLH